MPSILLPSRYTQQPQQAPQIDWSNPITAGLAFAFLLGGQTPVGIAGGASHLASAPYVAAALGPTPMGVAAKASSNVNRIMDTGSTGITSNTYSLFAAGTGTPTGVQSAIDDDSSSVGARRFQFRTNAGKVEFISFVNDSTNTGVIAAPVAMSAAEMARGFTMGATCSPTGTAVFQNGLKAIGSVSPGTPRSASGNFYIGCRKNTTTSGTAQAWLVGGLSLVAGWSRVLSDAEMQSLAANPWQIFRAPQRRLWYAATSASDATGALAANLDGALFTASGQVVAQGSFASTLEGAALAASGTVGNSPSGAIASTLAGASMSASGAVTNAGAFASTLAGVSMAASGIVTNRGTFASTLDGVSMSASGAVVSNASGTLSSTLDGATLAAGGYVGTPPAAPDFFIRLPKNPRHSLRH